MWIIYSGAYPFTQIIYRAFPLTPDPKRVVQRRKLLPQMCPVFNGESANSLISNKLADFSGERGIRTPGPVKINGFQDRRIRPLCHLSKVESYFAPCHVFREMDCKDKYFFRNRKRLGGKSVKNIENGGSGRWIADKNDYLAGCIENTSNTQEY